MILFWDSFLQLRCFNVVRFLKQKKINVFYNVYQSLIYNIISIIIFYLLPILMAACVFLCGKRNLILESQKFIQCLFHICIFMKLSSVEKVLQNQK